MSNEKEYFIGQVILPGNPSWSFFGKPSELDSKWRVALGQWCEPEEFPELFAKIGYKHGRRGNLFQLPDKSSDVVTAVGGENFYKSDPTYAEGYKDEARAAYPVIKVQ